MNKNRSPILTASALVFLLGFASNVWSQEKAEDWFIQGNKFSREGRFEDAVVAYKKSIKNNPKATVAYFNLALAYKNLNRQEEAAIAFEKAVELEPDNLDARYSLGNIYNHLERWEEAIGHLNIVVHRRQNDAEAHGNLGWAYYNLKKGPPFKYLVLINLRKAVRLFQSNNQSAAANATNKVLEEAITKFNLNTIN